TSLADYFVPSFLSSVTVLGNHLRNLAGEHLIKTAAVIRWYVLPIVRTLLELRHLGVLCCPDLWTLRVDSDGWREMFARANLDSVLGPKALPATASLLFDSFKDARPYLCAELLARYPDVYPSNLLPSSINEIVIGYAEGCIKPSADAPDALVAHLPDV